MIKFLMLHYLFLSCHCAEILGVFNHPGLSHTCLGQVLLKNLARKGHKVTMISAFRLEKPQKNIEEIILDGFLEDLHSRHKIKILNTNSLRDRLREIKNMTLKHTEETFKNQKVDNLVKSGKNFDVVIIDWFFNEATLLFGEIFDAPVIYLSSFGNNYLITDVTGNSLPFSYVPGFALQISDQMSFTSRFIITLYNLLMCGISPLRKMGHDLILKRLNTSVTVAELEKRVALVLSNSHFSLETPRPYTPNIIPIAGFHIEETTLPPKLQKFLDGAKEGVIYFSLGSQIKSAYLKTGVIREFLQVFAQLPLKILWKYEDDLQDLPGNVLIEKWVPQVAVLGHFNVKLFISHGGMLSFTEAVHFGVPILCIPVNGDQWTNAAFIESRKLGLMLKFSTLNRLLDTIREIVDNSIYKKNVDYYSGLLRNQPIKPIDNAIFWVEHVIKYKGAPHLQPFSTKLAWYQYYLLDVIACFLLTILVFLTFTVSLIKYCARLLRRTEKLKVF